MSRAYICPLCYKRFAELKLYLDHVKVQHRDFDGRTPLPENRNVK
jgi:hypothetical protein